MYCTSLIYEVSGLDDFKELYHMLFNSISDAIELLKLAQAKAEDLYIKTDRKTIEFKNLKN